MTLIPIPMCDQNLFRPFPSRELDDDACLSVRAASGPLACYYDATFNVEFALAFVFADY